MRLRLRIAAGAVIALAILTATGCDIVNEIKDKRKLEDLVQKGATRAEIARQFGDDYTSYEKGTPSWKDLERFLQREPSSSLRPVRDNAAKYPKIMYYTTMWRMTWIFLDENEVIRAYYFSAQ